MKLKKKIEMVLEAVSPDTAGKDLMRIVDGDLSHVFDAIQAGETGMKANGKRRDIRNASFNASSDYYKRIEKPTQITRGIVCPDDIEEQRWCVNAAGEIFNPAYSSTIKDYYKQGRAFKTKAEAEKFAAAETVRIEYVDFCRKLREAYPDSNLARFERVVNFVSAVVCKDRQADACRARSGGFPESQSGRVREAFTVEEINQAHGWGNQVPCDKINDSQ